MDCADIQSIMLMPSVVEVTWNIYTLLSISKMDVGAGWETARPRQFFWSPVIIKNEWSGEVLIVSQNFGSMCSGGAGLSNPRLVAYFCGSPSLVQHRILSGIHISFMTDSCIDFAGTYFTPKIPRVARLCQRASLLPRPAVAWPNCQCCRCDAY